MRNGFNVFVASEIEYLICVSAKMINQTTTEQVRIFFLFFLLICGMEKRMKA